MTSKSDPPSKSSRAGESAAASEGADAPPSAPSGTRVNTAASAERRTPRKPTVGKGAAKKRSAKKASSNGKNVARRSGQAVGQQAKYPRHPVERSLRIPRAILDQNAGHPCTPTQAAQLLGGTGAKASGNFNVEISSGKKYGFLEPSGREIALTDRARRILRPQSETDELTALREAVLDAPNISEVYNHYRGEFLPDDPFFSNTLVDQFNIPRDKLDEFREIFADCMRYARLVEDSGGREKLIDIGREEGARPVISSATGARRGMPKPPDSDATCFVMQPFAPPYGGYYESVFKPAIQQAGLRPVRADAEIFGAGKIIMNQVWRGIRTASVLVAELTTRNPNVFYELGLAHALRKPVVLVSSKEQDVPFDLTHIRVIHYDMSDPFWGQKLIDKIAENIRSAIANPEEAIFKADDDI